MTTNVFTAGTAINSSWRKKYFSSTLQQVMTTALVSEKCFTHDTSGGRYIENPYGSAVTAAIQAVAGTYSPSAFTVLDDTLAVNDEVVYGEQIKNFEARMSNFDIASNRLTTISRAIAVGVDYFVLNKILDMAGSSLTTPVGGFTTAANFGKIIGDLLGKVAGYADTQNGYFLVLENTDVSGIFQAQIGSGFNFSDMALRNGLVNNVAGVDIYVVRSGTFVTTTIGTLTAINSGHRLFGVKNVATFATYPPNYEEGKVTGQTGKEISVDCGVGARAWYTTLNLLVDITLA